MSNSVILNIYRPTSFKSDFFEESLEELLVAVDKFGTPIPNIVLCRDFNHSIINWKNNSSIQGDTRDSHKQAEAPVDLINVLCLHQYIIDEPTRIDNILYLFMTNNDNIVHTAHCKGC